MARGAFEQTIAHEVAAAARRNEKLSLVLLDIVGLRRINLQHGHKAGDEVLAQVAGRLRATVRGNDAMGRPGGDELAVLLVGANDAQAILVVAQDHPPDPERGDQGRRHDLDPGPAARGRHRARDRRAQRRSGARALLRRVARRADRRRVSSSPPTSATTPTDLGADTGSLSAGTTLGGTYRVVHELSRGAMGVVYRGEDLGLGRPVAIKVLRSDLASDRGLVDRFRAEAGILASLHHKNLVQVYALGEHAGDVYFVMELVEGQPLSEVLRATLERREWFPDRGDRADRARDRRRARRDARARPDPPRRQAGEHPARSRARSRGARRCRRRRQGRRSARRRRHAGVRRARVVPRARGRPVDRCLRPRRDAVLPAHRPPAVRLGLGAAGRSSASSTIRCRRRRGCAPGVSEAVDAVLAKALAPSPKKRWASASTFAIALGRALERTERRDQAAAGRRGRRGRRPSTRC